jgi:hypothetical protein
MKENQIDTLLNEIIDENNYLNYETIEELENIGGEALKELKLRLKKILYAIEFDHEESFWIFIKYIVKLLDCETVVEYLDNQYALKETTYDHDFLTLERLLKPILECYKKAPKTKAYQHALSVIKKINNNLLVPLCRELDNYNKEYYDEAIKVLSIISGIDEGLIRNCFLKVIKYSEDLIYFFQKEKEDPHYDPKLETLNGLLNKFYPHIEELIDKKFDFTEEIDYSSSNLDSKFHQNLFEMLQYIVSEEPIKKPYSKDELKSLIFEYFNNLTSGKLKVFSYVIVRGKKYFVREGVLDLSRSIGIHRFNDIDEIKGLDKLKNVNRLKLDGNFITEIKGLDHLTNLKELTLSHNKISEIKGLNNLYYLKKLNLSWNEITEIKGLDNLKNLEWINLYGNNIHEIKGLENLENLKYIELDISKMTDLNIVGALDAQAFVKFCREKSKK